MAKKKSKSASTSKVKQFPPLAVETVFQHLMISNVRLLNSTSQLHITNNAVPNKPKIKFTAELQPSDTSKTLFVDTHFSLHATANGDESPNASFCFIDIVYQCAFAVISDRPLVDFKEYAEQISATGVLVCWPYIRELVHTTGSRMNLPSFVLPLYSIGPGITKLIPINEESESKTPSAPKKKRAAKK